MACWQNGHPGDRKDPDCCRHVIADTGWAAEANSAKVSGVSGSFKKD
jgi:hypothetical protein